mgnify:FL=1
MSEQEMKFLNNNTNIVSHQDLSTRSTEPFQGQRWLVEERDACGVGFIAYQDGRQSNKIVKQALKALGCMEHRGGCSADRDSGDGAGIMTALPEKIFADWFAQNNIAQPEAEAWGVGMVFLPQATEKIAELKQYIAQLVVAEGLQVLGWREVPVRPEVLGQQARDNQPHIEQIVVSSIDGLVGDDLERKLYIAR